MRLAAATMMVLCGSWPAGAADLSRPTDIQVLMAPTAPIGLASAFPKSPLTESFVEGSMRFPNFTQARASCRSDVVVWVENGSKAYQVVGRADLALSGFGTFMCQAAALSEGDLPRRPGIATPD